MQGAGPMVCPPENQAIQLNPGEVAFQDVISKHALARSMGWSSPEIARAAHGAVAILHVFGSETPFSRHHLEPPFDLGFPFFYFETRTVYSLGPSSTFAERAGS